MVEVIGGVADDILAGLELPDVKSIVTPPSDLKGMR
jgi:hypothetical protein